MQLKPSPPLHEPHVREVVASRALLEEPQFRNLWLTQGIAQTSQNALLFTLLVVVLEITGSTVATSVLVLCFILPSIPLGFAVGVLLDRTDKVQVLVATNLIRAACCVLYFLFHSDELAIYGVSLVVATAGLFFNPAVLSLIPAVVPKPRLVRANSIYNFTLTASQLLGIVVVAPIALKTIGSEGMFIGGALLFLSAATFAALIKHEPETREPLRPQGSVFAGIPNEFRQSWDALAGDRYSVVALSQLIISSTLVLLFAILIPRYMVDVLGVPPDNAALVFAPTGIGALIGLRMVTTFTRWGKNRTVVIGLGGIAACLVLLALVEPIADVYKASGDWFDPSRLLRVSLLQFLVMCFALPMGFFYALLNAPAQTILHERAPDDMRGRIFATQVVMANFISLLPLLLVGAITDLLSVTAVLVLLAIGLGGAALASNAWGYQEPELDREGRVPQEAGTFN